MAYPDTQKNLWIRVIDFLFLEEPSLSSQYRHSGSQDSQKSHQGEDPDLTRAKIRISQALFWCFGEGRRIAESVKWLRDFTYTHHQKQ